MGIKRTVASWAGGTAARRVGPSIATRGAGQFVARAVDGFTGFPGAREVARKQLERTHDVDAAVQAVIDQHTRLAGVQGFVTNVGGFVTMPVAIPANLAGIAIVQLRMSAAIAHLRGYDVADPRVRAAALMTLLGEKVVREARSNGALPHTPHGLITAHGAIAEEDADRVAAQVSTELISRITGKHATLAFVRRVPGVGGAVSAGIDFVSTVNVGSYAGREFPPRLMVEQLPEAEQPTPSDGPPQG